MANVQNVAVATNAEEKTLSVFSEKLGANISIELESGATGFTSWMNGGWNNWGAICN